MEPLTLAEALSAALAATYWPINHGSDWSLPRGTHDYDMVKNGDYTSREPFLPSPELAVVMVNGGAMDAFFRAKARLELTLDLDAGQYEHIKDKSPDLIAEALHAYIYHRWVRHYAYINQLVDQRSGCNDSGPMGQGGLGDNLDQRGALDSPDWFTRKD